MPSSAAQQKLERQPMGGCGPRSLRFQSSQNL
jgi:hypothetical protein